MAAASNQVHPEAAAREEPPAKPGSLQVPIIHKRAHDVKGFLSGFTAAAVVDASPEEVLRLLSTPTEFPRVYSSCESVDGLEVAAPEPSGPPFLMFTMRNIARVLGVSVAPAMRMRLQADAAKRQVAFCQLAPAGMVTAMEGVNAVVPLPPGAHSATELETHLAGVTDAFLRSLDATEAAPPAPAPTAAAALPPLPFASITLSLPPTFGQAKSADSRKGGEPAAAPEQQCCVLVMHSRMKVKACPPGPLGKLLKSHLLSTHCRNLEDLLLWFQR